MKHVLKVAEHSSKLIVLGYQTGGDYDEALRLLCEDVAVNLPDVYGTIVMVEEDAAVTAQFEAEFKNYQEEE